MQQKVRAYHKTANTRFTQCGYLTPQAYEECIPVAIITQLSIQLGEPLFTTSEYSEDLDV